MDLPLCTHALTVDDDDWTDYLRTARVAIRRTCLLCGMRYDRSAFLLKLERMIRDRYRLPKSPWTAAERSEEA